VRSCLLALLDAARRAVGSLAVDSHGATAVEFAFVGPVLILLLFGIEETGRVMWTQAAINLAVEEAARCASVNATTCSSTARIQSYASSHAWGMQIPASEFTVTTPACGWQVSASHSYNSLVSHLVPFNLTLTAQSCFPKWS
jgi:Flp pilus assembly protein TadG